MAAGLSLPFIFCEMSRIIAIIRSTIGIFFSCIGIKTGTMLNREREKPHPTIKAPTSSRVSENLSFKFCSFMGAIGIFFVTGYTTKYIVRNV